VLASRMRSGIVMERAKRGICEAAITWTGGDQIACEPGESIARP
jgi:hypothetical protein